MLLRLRTRQHAARIAVKVSKPFLRATGVAGVAAGLITLTIVVLPYLYGAQVPSGDQVELHRNPLYQLRQWCSFLNIFAIVTAMWGLAAHRLQHSPGAASTGMIFVLLYGATELLGRSAMIFAREYRWVHELVESGGAGERTDVATMISGFDAVWSGWFVVILLTFTLSAALLGWSARGGSRLQRAVSWLLLAAAALGAVTLVARFVPWLREPARWAYPVIQPASRLVLGVFLLSESRKGADGSGGSP